MDEHTDPIVARLALSSGEVFSGYAFGAPAQRVGEVVFNTAMNGYQESLTDPSYTDQILVQTCPLIGNTGVNPVDTESGGVSVSGFVVHEHVDAFSNYRATGGLDAYLKREGVPGICGIDTRALTTILRSRGVTRGVISSDNALGDEDLVRLARAAPEMEGSDAAAHVGVTTQTRSAVIEHGWGWGGQSKGSRVPVGIVDCGAKGNIAACLERAGADPVLLPIGTDAATIKRLFLSGTIMGLMLSNGPGDPASLTVLISSVQALVEDPELAQAPIYGICLGHQILALAHGATTYKLAFGHRGVNHPVKDEEGAGVLITSQNHGFAVAADSISRPDVLITHTHLNDGTIAGLRRTDRPVRSVQFHPEASPGPHDAWSFFGSFVQDSQGFAAAHLCG